MPDTVGLRYLVIDVGQQPEREVVFVPKGGLIRHGIGTDAENYDVALQKLADFATPFAKEHDDVDVRTAGSRHLSQKCALAHTAAGEYAQPLSLATCQQAVDHADACRKWRVDARTA